MLWPLYLRRGIAYVPTVARTEAGYHLDVEPVEVIPFDDGEGIRRAVKQTLERGNAVVPTPTRATFPKPVLLKDAKLKSWASFERDAEIWTVSRKDGRYELKQRRRREDRGWKDVPATSEFLPQGAGPEEVAERISELIMKRDGTRS